MENPFSRLSKVLALERKQGYRNKAVIGGLDKFASRWENEARAACDSQSLVNEVVALMLGYSSVEGQPARERIIEQIARRSLEAEQAITGPEPRQPVRPAPPGAESRVEQPVKPAPVPPVGAPVENGGPITLSRELTGSPSKPRVPPPARLQVPDAEAPSNTRPAPSSPRVATGRDRSFERESGPAFSKPVASKPVRAETGRGPEPKERAAAPSRRSRLNPAQSRWGPAAAGMVGLHGRPPRPAANRHGDVDRETEPGQAATRGAASPDSGERARRRSPGLRAVGQPPTPDTSSHPKQGAAGTGEPSGRQEQTGLDAAELEAWLLEPAPSASIAPAPPQEAVEETRAAGFAQLEHPGEPGEELAGPDGAPMPPRTPWASPTLPSQAGAKLKRDLDAPVSRLPSIGPSLADRLGKIGVRSIQDLLYLLPRRYDDYRTLRTIDRLRYGDEVTLVGTVWHLETRLLGEGRRMVMARVGDGTGEILLTWFNPYVERQLRGGRAYAFSGKVDSYRGQLQMRSPEFEALDSLQISTARLVPIYPLTQGLNARWLRRVVKNTLDDYADVVPDVIPPAIRKQQGLLPIGAALAQVHFPDSQEAVAAARRRLSFDELLLLQLGVLGARREFRGTPARSLPNGSDVLRPFLASLPFALTGAQQRVIHEVVQDLAGTAPMSRLLQGDVGSGKTVVAAATLWVAVANGAQGAIMAPTEILAEQHYRTFATLFEDMQKPGTDRHVRVGLLSGSQGKSEREAALVAMASGDIDIAVGTHALIQDNVAFRDLGVAVVDEQHRFGVEQRAALRQKGQQPHMLVMSATPIPRSLALTIWGDLDLSVLDEMPAGRAPVRTKWLTSTYRERAYNFVRRQVAAGRQAFLVYPLVENREAADIEPVQAPDGVKPGTSWSAGAAVDEHARLQSQVFPELQLGLLHGRMKGDAKDEVMRAFVRGDLQVLVTTSVVEVGIDVPNATVMVVEGAERFGLAQLHQFRGRVGRGPYPSYCILISDADEGETAQRLEALETSTDGFALAQTDLEMRGPGDFLGTRQSGLPPLRMAQLSDLQTLEQARATALELLAEDPLLAQPEHVALAQRAAQFWATGDAS